MREKVQIGHNANGTNKLSVVKQAFSQPDFHRAYLTAAGRLFADFETQSSVKSEDALPVFFLQRHALELLIKNCLRVVYQLMLVEHKLGCRSEPPCQCKLERASENHNLNVLSKDLKAVLFFDNDSDSEGMLRLETLVAKMHSVDCRSTWSRFPEIDKKTCETRYINPTVLDLKFYQQEIEVLSAVLWGSDSDFYDAMLWKYHEAWNACMGELNDV